jgi:putative NADH-flavin reductase
MVKIALAGATSGIGLAIRQELDAQHTHEYISLVRKRKEDDEKAILVDYTSIEELEETLSAASVHTVISCLSISDKASGLAQLNLIEASSKTSCVKRFLPSEFGADYNDE